MIDLNPYIFLYMKVQSLVRVLNLNITETKSIAVGVEMSTFNDILKQKIRDEFHEQLPEKYWNLIDGVENPSDDREILCKLALEAGIPFVVQFIEKRGRKTHNVGILWNELPKLVGVTGTPKQVQDKTRDWVKNGWIKDEILIEKGKLLNSGNIPEFKFESPAGYKGRIYSNSKYIFIDGLAPLTAILSANKYNVTILNEWLKSLTLVTREFPRLAYETHVEINAIQHQHQLQIQQQQHASMHQQLEAQQQQIKLLEERPLQLPVVTEEMEKQIKLLQQLAINTAEKYKPRNIKKNWIYVVSTNEFSKDGIFKIGIASDFEKRMGEYLTHYPAIVEIFKVQTKNVDIIEKAIKQIAKRNDIKFVPPKELDLSKVDKDKDSEWFIMNSKEDVIAFVSHLVDSFTISQEMIDNQLERYRRRILQEANVEITEVIPADREDIKLRFAKRYIDIKLSDGIKEYSNFTKFKDDVKPILGFFKKDADYGQIPNDWDEILELLNGDIRIILEVRTKGRTKIIKASAA